MDEEEGKAKEEWGWTDPEKDTGDFRSNSSKPLWRPCHRQGDGAKPATGQPQ